ncbi:uncharacterized protein SPPG_08602 [Spizellomyces punctatus DAOM BR117]|uniref:Cyclin N-terminal domain-containing protein n=1 Tax=Spizellomyces punctatus (strain DAOM BR117) TaxID=645134 RepID=A0A0L0H5K7_SPIPD|nr:uncharacterized protein SPPG_08602 [Spizellomyces punctatus DAOM BR117]KNC96003.1 hypothetical protein SPPG_08602 [Spizellomyces punctatus DAOM BR117]|eukprot:XP_016604043.1 hypothetical protein SPPG_08602 [Spizellomyces punctatus DAOM BR117]
MLGGANANVASLSLSPARADRQPIKPPHTPVQQKNEPFRLMLENYGTCPLSGVKRKIDENDVYDTPVRIKNLEYAIIEPKSGKRRRIGDAKMQVKEDTRICDENSLRLPNSQFKFTFSSSPVYQAAPNVSPSISPLSRKIATPTFRSTVHKAHARLSIDEDEDLDIPSDPKTSSPTSSIPEWCNDPLYCDEEPLSDSDEPSAATSVHRDDDTLSDITPFISTPPMTPRAGNSPVAYSTRLDALSPASDVRKENRYAPIECSPLRRKIVIQAQTEMISETMGHLLPPDNTSLCARSTEFFHSADAATKVVPACPMPRKLLEIVEGNEKADMKIVLKQWKTDVEREEVLMENRRPDWISKHMEMNADHRGLLIDWMAEVCDENALSRRAYHLAVNFLDMYMSKIAEIPLKKLQLVGVAMLNCASKLEEQQSLDVWKICEFETQGYHPDEHVKVMQKACKRVVKYEADFMIKMNWNLCISTAHDFLTRSFQLARLWSFYHDIHKPPNLPVGERDIFQAAFTLDEASGAFFVLQACMAVDTTIRFRNSMLAAAVFFLTYPFEDITQAEDLTHIVTGYTKAQLEECLALVEHIAECARDAKTPLPDEQWHRCQYGHHPDLALQTRNEFDVGRLLDNFYRGDVQDAYTGDDDNEF